ncbi:unnamed protein product [Protopolystoma xenopodis]|uniref:Uncharacterized protein n=1 Tax=Protopolystoma xenopodis TaxID=117903 RepID=A0A3S4ZUF9_9PLAT|nr:unnamed protein product [Protopolystoma xenopodis]
MFARLTLATLDDFRWRLMDALTACPLPKYRLLSRDLFLTVVNICRRSCCSLACLLGGQACWRAPTIGRDNSLFSADFQRRLLFPSFLGCQSGYYL